MFITHSVFITHELYFYPSNICKAQETEWFTKSLPFVAWDVQYSLVRLYQQTNMSLLLQQPHREQIEKMGFWPFFEIFIKSLGYFLQCSPSLISVTTFFFRICCNFGIPIPCKISFQSLIFLCNQQCNQVSVPFPQGTVLSIR